MIDEWPITWGGPTMPIPRRTTCPVCDKSRRRCRCRTADLHAWADEQLAFPGHERDRIGSVARFLRLPK